MPYTEEDAIQDGIADYEYDRFKDENSDFFTKQFDRIELLVKLGMSQQHATDFVSGIVNDTIKSCKY